MFVVIKQAEDTVYLRAADNEFDRVSITIDKRRVCITTASGYTFGYDGERITIDNNVYYTTMEIHGQVVDIVLNEDDKKKLDEYVEHYTRMITK